MRIKLVLKLMSVLMLILAAFMIPCFITAMIYDTKIYIYSFGIIIACLVIPGAILLISIKHYLTNLTIKDGLLLVSLTWLFISALSALPYYFTGTLENWSDCLFEAASGVSTTGATVINDVEILGKSILLWRSTTHWVGGLGIIILSVALLPLLGVGGLKLFRTESSGLDSDKMTPRIAQTAKILWSLYVTMTFTCFLLLKFGGMTYFDAVNHAMSALSSGGFSTKNASIGYYKSSYIQWVIILSMFFAGVNFSLLHAAVMGKFHSIWKNSELKAYILIVFISGFVITLINHGAISQNLSKTIRDSFFQVLSVMSTTGFINTDFNKWPYLSQFILLILMFGGACAGSTSGGFKIIRLVVLMKQSFNEIRSLLHPRGVFALRLNGAHIDGQTIYSVFGFLFLYMITVAAVSLVVASSNADIATSVSSGFTIVGNVGPGFGAIGSGGNFSAFPGYVKYFLSIAMIMGRLEIYAFFALLSPYFWRRFK